MSSFLYFSPVGRSAEELLPEVLDRVRSNGGDVLLGVYDDWKPAPWITKDKGIMVVRELGMRKWQMARRHLGESNVQDYDYIFLWDDDLAISDFDPSLFLEIMKNHELDCAQPSIFSPHPLTHSITRQVPCGYTLGNGRVSVGRFTTFVEIMAPVYSRKGWARVYPHISDSNPEAFGYDFIPVGQRGIVDCMQLIHTRESRAKPNEALEEQERFFHKTGFMLHEKINMGHLTMPVDRSRSRY